MTEIHQRIAGKFKKSRSLWLSDISTIDCFYETMTEADPCGYLTSPPSIVVKITNTSRDDINGLLGIATSFNQERNRYLVFMTDSQSTMALRRENLVKANMFESYRCQWHQLKNDPRVRQKMGYYVSICRQYVYPLDLFSVVSGMGVLWFLLFVRVGILKTIMTMIMTIILMGIVTPDIIAKAPLKIIIQNFPRRSKQALEAQIPIFSGRLSNRVSAGIMCLLVALCLRSLWSSSGSSNILPETKLATASLVNSQLDQESIDIIYDLGYQDGTKGNTHGASLEEVITALKNRKGNTRNILGDLFSVKNFASVFYLFKSLAELGIDQSTGFFSMGQLAENFQYHTDWWTKVLLLLNLFNVLKNLLFLSS